MEKSIKILMAATSLAAMSCSKEINEPELPEAKVCGVIMAKQNDGSLVRECAGEEL